MTHEQQIKRMQELSTIDGFTRVFYRHLGTGITQEQAFNLTNEQYIQYYRRPRYANFESYRKAREYHRKQNK